MSPEEKAKIRAAGMALAATMPPISEEQVDAAVRLLANVKIASRPAEPAKTRRDRRAA